MDILFLGGVFDPSHQNEILSKTNTYVEYAANNFQIKIIKGLKETGNTINVISAPFLGSYPNAYKEFFFNGFEDSSLDFSGFHYVNFVNVWGIRNLSRTHSLKKALKNFALSNSKEKLIVIYTPHTPLLKAANYAKKLDPRINTCLVVPDLPQYMNLSDRISFAYRIIKKLDIKSFNKENEKTDLFVLLTESMKEPLKINNRNYVVIEGIYEKNDFEDPYKSKVDNKEIKTIVYTGKLNKSFGVLNLVNAFMKIKDENIKLIICGNGDDYDHISELAEKDRRIELKGQVSIDIARNYIKNATVLVNPRQNNSIYTKYSFPSKIIDYLSTGNPVVAYKLDGMPDIYENFIYFVENDSDEALRKTIEDVLKMSQEEKFKKSKEAIDYLNTLRTPLSVAENIIDLFYSK